MSESSSKIPKHTIDVPLSVSTTKTIEREEPKLEAQKTSYEEITSSSKVEETQTETQSIAMTNSSLQLQEVMVKKGNHISYGSLPKPPVCNANQYGKCIKPVDEENRPCTVYNRCKRDDH